ncbi:uncharacterized protein LOC134837161 [Culicoides brevitarsis]|uniref:uncharacterized protein LOC134837161 n=1 Tax=Culicoides brevitarsis TaxID=469753 RepID=UPI00307B7FBA
MYLRILCVRMMSIGSKNDIFMRIMILNSIENNEIGDEIRVSKEENIDRTSERPEIQPKTLRISPSLIFSVKNIYFHKDYDGQFFNNIAVMELDRRVSLLNGVNVIGIVNNYSYIYSGDTLSLYGWDNQLILQNPAHVISKVSLNLINSDNCLAFFGSNFKNDSELCLKAISHVPSNGFGGSPVTKNGLLVGILSYGAPPGTPKNSPDQLTVAVNLTHYTEFIEQVHDDIERADGSFILRFVYLMRSTWQGLISSFTFIFENM